MTDSHRSETLSAKHEQNRQERLEGVKRWVEYIQQQPPETWGTQQNRLIDSQLASARESGLTPDHEQRVQAFAAAADHDQAADGSDE